MSTSMKLSLAALAFTAGLVGCGDARATDAAQEDLKRDLQLASATTMNLATPRVDSALLNSMETEPQGAPEVAKTVKKGAGNRALRSQTPTVLATPEADVAAVDETEEVETESLAPVPEPTNEPVAVAPRPQPVIAQTGGAGDYGTSGGGVFGGGSGRGVVIRGGGVDGDNCEIHRGGRGGVIVSRGPIYLPQPTAPRTGGIFIGRGTSGGRSVARVPDRPRSSSSTTLSRPSLARGRVTR